MISVKIDAAGGGWNSFDRDDDRYAVAGHEQEGIVYQRMDESLDALWNLWQQDPFDGILGFSQGAITASIFVDWMARTKPADHLAPKFLILVSAFLKPVPLNYPEYWIRDQDRELLGSLQDPAIIERFQAGNVHGLDPTDAEDIDVWRKIHGIEHEPCEAGGFVATKRSISTIPSLHIYGEGDSIMPNARSLALALLIFWLAGADRPSGPSPAPDPGAEGFGDDDPPPAGPRCFT